MSRTLKRPMFRRGGSTNDGIMSGIVDREQTILKNGDIKRTIEQIFIEQLESLLKDLYT